MRGIISALPSLPLVQEPCRRFLLCCREASRLPCSAQERSSPRASPSRPLPDRALVNAEVRRCQSKDGDGCHLPDAPHPDITRLVDAGLNREDTGKIDFVDLTVATFDFPADFQ